MDIRIPTTPAKEHLKLERVAARWQVPKWYAKQLLQEAGIELVDIEVPPAKGVRLKDLLQYENTRRKNAQQYAKLEVLK
jgi:hypothetical protein